MEDEDEESESIQALQEAHENSIISGYLLSRGIDMTNKYVIAGLYARSKIHIDKCHSVISALIIMVLQGGIHCDGSCRPTCSDHRRLYKAGELLKWT